MSLDLAHEKLGWPSRGEVLSPPGEGARIFADLAKTKIGAALARQPGGANAGVGVLASNPNASATESPLAVVCEFEQGIADQTLRELQKLAWNFSRSPMLVTIEPHLLRAWTCCEPPSDRLLPDYVVHELSLSDLATGISQRATQVLHWINLVSGRFFKENSSRFRRDQRADQMLLENLSFVRQQLHRKGLDNSDVCHDLLARVIFIQFLFDRKDSSGNSALNESVLDRLHFKGVLRKQHTDFASILSNYDECYRLFRYLNERFNGDLFPSKGHTEAECEKAWQAEKQQVKPVHMEVLRDLVSGDLHMPTGQLNLWRKYAFDAIPLEFISSIYEAFVTERTSYYTPPYLVDFTLDHVLPWNGTQWDLKVLDPACGSGVFLVKAFQRLVHRWKNSHPNETIKTETLRGLLENNLVGVDIDPHAVRVASFSLYLAMCDEIDPKYYWAQVRFPLMRERRLINADFFREDRVGFRTQEDAASYDLVTGNAPWGEKTLTEYAKNWADDEKHKWSTADKGIGTLFLPKAAYLAKPEGKVAMIQPASALLFNRSGPASEFREKFFNTFRIEQVVNLSALRFEVFKKKKKTAQKTVSPSCVIVFSPQPTNAGDRLYYSSPKAIEENGEAHNIITEPADVKEVHAIDCATDPDVWTTLMWGNQRDINLVRWLTQLPNLKKLEEKGRLTCREGIIRGTHPEKQKENKWLLDRPILETDTFPSHGLLHLFADKLPKNDNAWAERSRKEEVFSPPQLIIKKSWSVEFSCQARFVIPDKQGRGVVCTHSFLSVFSKPEEEALLESACLAYNSLVAVYFLFLTSGRFASYIPEALSRDIRRIPIPDPQPGLLESFCTTNDLNQRVRKAFALKPAEWVLVEDMCKITLEDFKGNQNSPGRKQTQRRLRSDMEPELEPYCDHFIRVLKAGFGQDKQISATIFQERGNNHLLPFRLVAFQLDHAAVPAVQVETLESLDLLAKLETLNKTWLKSTTAKSGNIYHQRVARVYDTRDKIPTIFIIKPDAYRYWTRSMGLNDADEAAADLVRWQRAASTGGGRG